MFEEEVEDPSIKQHFLCILDLEATCEHSSKPPLVPGGEIIEFASILLLLNKSREFDTIDEFQSFIKPVKNPTLTPFCTKLTSITQEQVDSAELFPEVLERHINWLKRHGVFETGNKLTFVTVSDNDLESMLPSQIKLSNIEEEFLLPIEYESWIDLKQIFRKCIGEELRSCKLTIMLDLLKLSVIGHLHRGIDDCRNTVQVVKELNKRYGYCFFTKTGQNSKVLKSSNFNGNAFYMARAHLLDLFSNDFQFNPLDQCSFPLIDCDTPYAVGSASCAVWNALTEFKISENRIKINPDRAILSLRQERYLKRNDVKVNLWDEFSGIYECADGSEIQLHCNFPNHRDAALLALEYPKNKEQARENCKRLFMTNTMLEEKVLQLGGAAAAIHESSAPKFPLSPLIEIIRHENNKSNSSIKTNRKLRVIDLTRVLAGPICTRVLKEIKGNDVDVLTVTSKKLPQVEEARLLTSLGKRSAFCDFNDVDECEQFKQLLKDCDIFVQAFRPNCLEKFHFEAADNPSLIRVNIRAFEDSNRRGFDSLLQCHTGMLSAHSKYVNNKEHLPVQALDHLTGLLGALGALIAVQRRKKFGGSYVVNVSLERTAYWLMHELPIRRNFRMIGGLQEIEKRTLPKILKTRVLSDGSTLTYLRGVLDENDEDETEQFVLKAGADELVWN